MIEQPPRGSLKEGLTFGYVDVPENITVKDRPFLDKLTSDSLELQKVIRKGKEINIRTEDTSIVSQNQNVPVRIFTPDGEGPFPMVLYYHGGGFALRDIPCFDFIGRYIASGSSAVVFMPEYSLSPENKFPIALEQCYDALNWARENAMKYNAYADKLIVAGDSAGGNISTVVSMMCRDRHKRMPSLQILAYPVVDHTPGGERESERLYAKNYNLDYAHFLSYGKAYVRDQQDFANPYCSPLFGDVKGLPPCYMILAECDILLDQGLEYAKYLKDSGVDIQYKIYKGMPHDFLFYGFEESYEAYEDICNKIKTL